MALRHELEVELFRTQPELACELLRRCAGIEPGRGRAELGSSDLAQVVSVEYRADAVTILRDPLGKVIASIVVEVQRKRSTAKRYTWPLYVTALRARLRCPVYLLVIVPSWLGRWARKPIEVGHPNFCLRPVVIELGELPVVPDPTGELHQLVMLSALGHPGELMARSVAQLFPTLDAETLELYSTLIVSAWPNALRNLLEDMMRPELAARLKQIQYDVGRVDALRAAACELARAKDALTDATEAKLATLSEAELMRVITALGEARDRQAALAVLGDA